MRFILIFLTLVLGLCDAARRTTTTTSTQANFEGRHLGHRGKSQEDSRNVWDLVELQKLDKQDFWNKDPNTSANTTNPEGSNVLSGRQSYPTLPGPGDTNELPGPIATPKPIEPPPPGCYGPRGQFPSPRSCANYLNCWDGVVIEQTCPDGLLFNAITLVCDYDYNVNCGDRPLPTPKPPIANGSELCPDPNGRYRSATNCSEFYVCVFGRPVKFSCPRGLVYNDLLNVCDYPYNVDCKGSATPAPTTPPITIGPITQSPSKPPQPPTYPPTQPPYGQPGPPPYGQPGPSYPWLNLKANSETWNQQAESSQLDDDKSEESLFEKHPQPPETSPNPWNVLQNIPASLVAVPCKNGDIHRLNEACTNVVVCRSGRPQLVQCSSGLIYDRPSDSCQPHSVAKWWVFASNDEFLLGDILIVWLVDPAVRNFFFNCIAVLLYRMKIMPGMWDILQTKCIFNS
ncbi:uncharacterized protein LOC128880836 [Hylaeus volcanicus]|uniref:uncharacterized protein LOC128880836 n=1 Tax=Hylaeus volcanicus TaxID=313075 RepID=UPI0023B8192E|nr:uncharacterized protein LOC128880836 [Hylaeus volcanicus]